MKVEHPRELRSHWNPDDPKQLFWIDDAFGMLQYDFSRTHDWNAILPWLNSVIASGAKIVLTSRNYIYARARTDLKQTAFPLLKEAEVVVDVAALTLDERQKILYSHVRLGGQPSEWRQRFKRCFSSVAEHSQFMPETARRFGTPAYTTKLRIPDGAIDFVERPAAFLRETIEGLSSNDRGALAAIFLRGGALRSPVDLRRDEITLIERLGSAADMIPGSLAALRDSIVRFSPITNMWEFKHPTIGDAFGSILADDPELLDLYVTGAPIQRMANEVTCGVVTVAGAAISVPESRYAMVALRLTEYSGRRGLNYQERDSRRRLVDNFLARRCSKQFLEIYIDQDAGFLDRVTSVGSYLAAGADFPLLHTLREYGLLSSERTSSIIGVVKELAVETPDADFVNVASVREFFTEEEVDDILEGVRHSLLPALDQTIRDWESNRRSSDEPSAYYEPLIEALEAFRKEFLSDRYAQALIEGALEGIKEIIEENSEPEPDSEDVGYYASDRAQGEPDASDREIFDDLDE